MTRCFIIACVWYMKNLGSILSHAFFLLGFCFENPGFLATQLSHVEACLITVFVIITFFDPYNQYVLSTHSFIMTTIFSWQHNLEILSIKDLLDDFLMCLCISLAALKILKSCLLGLILINSKPRSFYIGFRLLIS